MCPCGAVREERAFTILELIAVIALVVLLLSLLAPVLHGAWNRAGSTRTLANLRTHASNTAAYTGDWGESFPAMTRHEDEITRVVVNGREYNLNYWSPTVMWPLAMLNEGYESNMAHPSLIERDDEVAQPWGNWAYSYAASFLARPEFWNPRTREGVHQLASTRVSEVRFPAQKGLFVPFEDLPSSTLDLQDQSRRWRIGFVDASARAVPRGMLGEWYRSGEGGHGSGSSSVGFPVTHTIDGIHGLDVR